VPDICKHVYNTNAMTGIVADRVFGNQGEVPLHYDPLSKRFATTNEEMHYRYALEGVYVD
jgi:hypothetical protein